jgi:hypothetical protein
MGKSLGDLYLIIILMTTTELLTPRTNPEIGYERNQDIWIANSLGLYRRQSRMVV